MRRLLPWVLVIAGVAVGAFLLRPGAGPAAVPQHEPGPGDPPVVWLTGRLTEIGDDHLVIRQGEGPAVEMQRLAGGATSFHRPGDGAWLELSLEQTQRVETGQRACVEALLDGELYVAIRVYLGAAGCGPV